MKDVRNIPKRSGRDGRGLGEGKEKSIISIHLPLYLVKYLPLSLASCTVYINLSIITIHQSQHSDLFICIFIFYA